MCRYAEKEYKSHFACFDCRKAFKKTAMVDWVQQKGLASAYATMMRSGNLKLAEKRLGRTYKSIRDEYLKEVADCPQCGKEMAAMGLDFKAPKNTAIEQWQIVRVLYDHGFAFHGCGCNVGYRPPTKLSGLEDFFEEHGRVSEGAKLLRKIARGRM